MRNLMLLTIFYSNLVGATVVMYEVGSPKKIEISHHKKTSALSNFTRVKQFSVDKTYITPSILTEGIVKTKQIKSLKNIQPFFVVGYGSKSIEWLRDNSKKLKDIGALPFAINIKSRQEYQHLQSAFNGDLVITNMDKFKDLYAINSYPFLVANGWIEQ